MSSYIDIVIDGGPWAGATARCLLDEHGKPPLVLNIDDATGQVLDGDGQVIGKAVRAEMTGGR